MKKFLSLVLALVMTMSLVTVSAGAKDTAGKPTKGSECAADMQMKRVRARCFRF